MIISTILFLIGVVMLSMALIYAIAIAILWVVVFIFDLLVYWPITLIYKIIC